MLRLTRSCRTACLGFVMGLALLAAGCEAPPRQPLHLHPIPPGGPAANVPMFFIQVARVQHRVRPDAPVEDLWRLLGTADVPYEKRKLWKTNDLRLGDGAHLAADRLHELMTETADRSVQTFTLTVRENMDFVVTMGGNRDSMDLLWTDASGHTLGRRFTTALAEFHLVCRSDPQDPQVVRVALAPEVRYGPEGLHWVRTETGYLQQSTRDAFLLSDLAAEVELRPGRMLVIGGQRTSDLSVGGAFFQEHRGPDLWVQTIILAAERVQALPPSPGESVLFVPRPTPMTPTKTKTPLPGAPAPSTPGAIGPAVPTPTATGGPAQ